MSCCILLQKCRICATWEQHPPSRATFQEDRTLIKPLRRAQRRPQTGCGCGCAAQVEAPAGSHGRALLHQQHRSRQAAAETAPGRLWRGGWGLGAALRAGLVSQPASRPACPASQPAALALAPHDPSSYGCTTVTPVLLQYNMEEYTREVAEEGVREAVQRFTTFDWSRMDKLGLSLVGRLGLLPPPGAVSCTAIYI